MPRRGIFVLWLLASVLPVIAPLTALLGEDTYVVICRVDPPTAGLKVTIVTPGGLEKVSYTGSDGVARVYLRPTAGIYRAYMQSSEEEHWFELSPVVELTFRLGPARDTPTAVYTPLWTTAPATVVPTLTDSPTVLPVFTPSLTDSPTVPPVIFTPTEPAKPGETPTLAWPTELPTPRVIRLKAEIYIDWWPDEDVWNVSGAVWSVEK